MNQTHQHNADDRLDPHVLAHELEHFGRQYADKKHAYELLNKTRASLLSKLTNDVRREFPAMSRKEAQDMAEGSDDYVSHLIAIVDAEREKNYASAIWKSCQAKFEGMRTAEATRRAELYHGR